MPSDRLGDATIRAFSSLTRRDADAVRATIRAAATGHAVQEHDDYDGYLSLLVTPDDEARPSFMVAGRVGAVDLAQLRGDEMTAIGTFPSIGAAMIVLRPALECAQPEREATLAAEFVMRHGDDAAVQAALQVDAQPGRLRWPSILRALDNRGEQA